MPDSSAMKVGRAIVLESSLASALPRSWADRLISRRVHQLGRLQEVVVLEYSFQRGEDEQIAFELANRIAAPGYYAHLVLGDSMIVVFPKTIVLLRRGETEMFERCRAVGRSWGIPDNQMKFECMFDIDHPDEVLKGS